MKTYTLGYCNFPNQNDLLKELKTLGVKIVFDIRSIPFSKHFSQYNKPFFSSTLRDNGIFYSNPHDMGFKIWGKASDDAKQKEVEFILTMCQEKKWDSVVFMCCEADINGCHRKEVAGIVKGLTEYQGDILKGSLRQNVRLSAVKCAEAVSAPLQPLLF